VKNIRPKKNKGKHANEKKKKYEVIAKLYSCLDSQFCNKRLMIEIKE